MAKGDDAENPGRPLHRFASISAAATDGRPSGGMARQHRAETRTALYNGGMSRPAMPAAPDYATLAADIKRWARELGFADAGHRPAPTWATTNRTCRPGSSAGPCMAKWITWPATAQAQPPGRTGAGHATGDLRAHGLRAAGHANAPGTCSSEPETRLRLALRAGTRLPQADAHRLQKLADRITAVVGAFGYRAFVDSAPVLEKALARDAGLGWIGKHTLAAQSRGQLLVLARRAVHRPAAAAGPARQRALRQLPPLHRHLPDAGDRRALPAGCAALHFLSDDRTEGHDPRGTARTDGQPHLRLRRLPAGLPVEQVRAD